jgi:hypothetical protein
MKAKTAKPQRTSTKKKTAQRSAKKQGAASNLDWSAAIKKAAQDKRSQASWPGTGEAWKKKTRT